MMKLPSFLLLSLAAAAAQATDFQLAPVKLPGGVTVFGTVSTDGSVGALTPANLTAWRVTVRSTTRYDYVPGQAGGPHLMGVSVSADGRKLRVATSPDGVNDGGILAFGSFGPGPEYGVQVANFSGYYAAGGVAFYLAGPAFEWQDLAAPDHSQHVVAAAPVGSAVYKLLPVSFPSGAAMTGTITTDGSTGAIGAAQVLDWRIRVQAVDDVTYFKDASGNGNSVVMPGSGGLSTDGSTLFVARPGGYLAFGVPANPPRRSVAAVPADFGPDAPRKGRAGYFDAFNLQYTSLKFGGTQYPVAQAMP
ncbi:MAG: hypothetical protein U1F53_19675 [Burkholderiaceae bacterium]